MNYLIVIILIAVIYIITIPGKNKLKYKFNKLGDISGAKRENIISALGRPNTSSVLANGTHLLQWCQNDYHIGIVFDDQGNVIRISNLTQQ